MASILGIDMARLAANKPSPLDGMLHAGVRSRCAHEWQLNYTPKFSSSGVVRSVPPSSTIRRVAPLMRTIGVTRIAEVTQLDRVGVPNFVAVRPRDLGPGISYYNGKGTTRAAAKAGAMMEAIERYSGERCDLPVSYCTYDAMRQRAPTVNPRELIVPTVREFESKLKLEWVEGFDLLSHESTFVPLNAVVCPYAPLRDCALYYASTNGLASGNTMEEALCHALCEVIERDALAISLTALRLRPAVQSLLHALGHKSALFGHSCKSFPLVSLERLPHPAAQISEKLLKTKLHVYLRNITSTARIPTFDCTIVEDRLNGGHLAHSGAGTHPDARVALVRALTEAAQSRVAWIQGGREDLPEIKPRSDVFDPDRIFGSSERCSFSSIASHEYERVDEDIHFLLQRLKAAGFGQVIAVNLTRPELGVPVVRVIVPRAETWTVFHLHTGRGIFGGRIASVLSASED